MKYFSAFNKFAKQFEYYDTSGEDAETTSKLEDARETLESHMFGTFTNNQTWQKFEEAFDGVIRAGLMYYGEVYRLVFFFNKKDYIHCLEEGMDTRRSFAFSCTKSLDTIDALREQLQTDAHRYYVIYKLQSDSNSCFFDLESMCEELSVYYEYPEEQEVLIRSSAVPVLRDIDVVSHGKIEDLNDESY